MNPSAQTLRKRIAERARHRCGYCLTLEVVSGIPLTLEHIIPKAKGRQDVEENLWLSCRLCNEAKGVLTEAIDPQTSVPVHSSTPEHKSGRSILSGARTVHMSLGEHR